MDQINNQTKYIIGLFEEEKKYSVIPVSWLKNSKEGYLNCSWPNARRVTAMSIMKGGKPTSKWTTHPVKLIEEFGSYEAAAAKEIKIFISSGGESQSDSEPEEPNNSQEEDYNASSSSDDEEVLTIKRKQSTYVPSKKLKQNIPDSVPDNNTACIVSSAMNTLIDLNTADFVGTSYNNGLRSVLNSNPTMQFADISSILIDDDFNHMTPADKQVTEEANLMKLKNISGTSTTNNNDVCELNLTSELGSFELEFLKNKMDQILHTTDIYFTRLDKKLDAIMDYIKINPNSSVQPTLDTHFLGLFPLNDVESLINFDEFLKTDENSTKLINLIKSIGGSGTKHFVKRVLNKLFSNKLATLCSWTGQKNNHRLVDHQIIKIMKKISHELYQNDENIFEIYVKDWFRHGAQRLKKETTTDSTSKTQSN
ncbi:uncharacterized protein LOC132935907 [Metopolophium dirhodum]|uniref:uncharacterized protein LOC132935907 n=1 Tax=Metopolophium dirhodum TaxID=44670 RepID=UPI00298FA0D8|nr:uncharacterized protein LOC132935907 [Metopolophium dirhodum]